MFSMFSLTLSPCATWRGALAMSNMSHKNCDRKEFTVYVGSWSNDMEDTEATPAMPTTVLQSVLLKSARSQCEGV